MAEPAGPAPTNASLFQRAQRSIPGGVSSPVRSFAAVGGTPYFVSRAKGAHVWDVEGRQLVDYVQSYGASILGHAHPRVVEAVRRAAGGGTSFGAPTEAEVMLAEEICASVAGCEQVRFTSSGTEATMSAIRVARGLTGRDLVVKFDGCYHGHSDGLLAGGGSGIATLGIPSSKGVPEAAVAQTMVVPFNVVPEVTADVACVIVEPVAANMGVVDPVPGFLESLRAACDEVGAILIFDEVITGFRVGRGGAAERYGVLPDMWCFGKVIGGGLPVGAFGASEQVMSALAPSGPVYQAGTLSGNPLAMAAGLAVLGELDSRAFSRLAQTATQLGDELASALADAGVAAQVPVVGPLVGLFFSEEPVKDYASARRAASNGMYAAFFRSMLSQGVALAPGPYEAIFPSLAHSPEDIEATISAAHKAALGLARESLA